MLQKVYRLQQHEPQSEVVEFKESWDFFSNYLLESAFGNDCFELEPLEPKHVTIAGVTGAAHSHRLSFVVRGIGKDGYSVPSYEEIADTAVLLCGFAFNAFVSDLPEIVARTCRPNPGGRWTQPWKQVPRIYEPEVKEEAATQFLLKDWINQSVRLSRAKFRALKQALNIYNTALHTLPSHPDAALAMLVFAMEGLAEVADETTLAWEQYPEDERVILQPLLDRLGPDEADQIKHRLMATKSTGATRKFVDFAERHLSPQFFDSTSGTTGARLRRSQMKSVLSQAYQMRSLFVHQLKGNGYQGWFRSAHGEVFHSPNGMVSPTLRGVLRLTREVITQFVVKADKLEHENLNWAAEEEWGTVRMAVHPDHWFYDYDFQKENAKLWFEAALLLFQEYEIGNRNEAGRFHAYMMVLVKRIIQQYPEATTQQREFLVGILIVAFHVIPDKAFVDEWKARASKLKPWSAESLPPAIAETITQHKVSGTLGLLQKELARNMRKPKIDLPLVFEAAVGTAIAHAYDRSNDTDAAFELLRTLRDETGAILCLQRLIDDSLQNDLIPSVADVLQH